MNNHRHRFGNDPTNPLPEPKGGTRRQRSLTPEGTQSHFYRTAAGAEIDLLLVLPGGDRWAIEVKRSLSPRPERGFHQACADIRAAKRFVVYPGEESYAASREVEAIGLRGLGQRLLDGGTS